ncbi:MAG: hypothetical protein OQK82_01175 [Candidatus Pacearchaeota archaeon]|nr:hypothetical protein [Candidatus Pacearchaeota archaeon]
MTEVEIQSDYYAQEDRIKELEEQNKKLALTLQNLETTLEEKE